MNDISVIGLFGIVGFASLINPVVDAAADGLEGQPNCLGFLGRDL